MASASVRVGCRLARFVPLGLAASPLRDGDADARPGQASWAAPWRCPLAAGGNRQRPLLCEEAYVEQTSNAVLATQHRVGLCNWPVRGARLRNDPRTQTLEALFEHVASSGYDGVEISFVQFKGYYMLGINDIGEADGSVRDEEFAELVRSTASRHGVSVLGATYHIMDGRQDALGCPDFADADFLDKLSRRMVLDRKMGAGYVNFQVYLPPRYMQTPLAWRDDEHYLYATVERSLQLQGLCWQHGLNAYFETHIDRWGEDPVFMAEVLAKAEARGGLEANGDLSHYLHRGWTKGSAVESILRAVNHLHVRMCRVHGDLSAETAAPFEDFAKGGPTREQWDMILRVGPLTSRTVCGEAGPMHLVKDTLGEDAKMVPLLRAIAAEKDGSNHHLAKDFNPFPAPTRACLTKL